MKIKISEHYLNLVEESRNRPFLGRQREVHHIIPRTIFKKGTLSKILPIEALNDPRNLVEVSCLDHVKLHVQLWLDNPTNHYLAKAATVMADSKFDTAPELQDWIIENPDVISALALARSQANLSQRKLDIDTEAYYEKLWRDWGRPGYVTFERMIKEDPELSPRLEDTGLKTRGFYRYIRTWKGYPLCRTCIRPEKI